jgi:hypothetical protein
MRWSRTSVAALGLSCACLALAVGLLLTRSNERAATSVRFTEPGIAATATPVIYIDSPIPWRTPIPRPEPMYGPLPFVTPPGAQLKPPNTDTPGPPATALQLRQVFFSDLERMSQVLEVMTGASSCTGTCLMPAGFEAQFELLWMTCLKGDPRGAFRTPFAVNPNPPSVLEELGDDPEAGPVIRAAADACAAVRDSYQRLGAPADTPPWHQAMEAILSRLEPVMAVERSRPVTYPPPP